MQHLLLLLAMLPLFAYGQQWSSDFERTDTVELFTSEGCSSCPPADQWFSSLKDRDDLFSGFVPLAFHVDYWNRLGWKDRFSRPAFSDRQRRYVREGLVSQSYTPGIVINSREWRQWFQGKRDWTDSTEKVGRLSVHLDAQSEVTASFTGSGAGALQVAILGMGLTTEVLAGENRGTELTHDFVVLDMHRVRGEGQWRLSLPDIPDVGQQTTAIAVWVTAADSQRIIQATGGYLGP